MAKLASSRSYELILKEDGRTVLSITEAHSIADGAVTDRPRVRGERLFLTMKWTGASSPLRLRLGPDFILDLPVDRQEWTINLGEHFREDFGDVEVVLEDWQETEEYWTPALRLAFEVVPPPGLVQIFDAIVRDLEACHVGLAQDILGRASRQGGRRGWPPRAIRPEEDLKRLEEIRSRLESAIRRIANQPSSTLVRTVHEGRWRPGDRCDARVVAEAVRSPETVFGSSGHPLAIGKLRLRRCELSSDIEEHRQLKDGLDGMARWADGLVTFCRQAARLLQDEESRWGTQVFEERYLPRIRRYREIGDRAVDMARGLRGTSSEHAFLRAAGPPRTRFGPSPIFQGRHEYREAYACLKEARQRFGILVDAEGSLRFKSKRFSVLYEYWCFIQVVMALRKRFGSPGAEGTYTLIDDVYRPDLRPGQTFRFRLPSLGTINVTYEPEFFPVGQHRTDRFAAALVSGPLRPDILVEILEGDAPPVMMVLDAKSTRKFSRESFREVSDYRGLIHDPRTGHQPVRQLFLVHADEMSSPRTNLTGYLEGVVSNRDASIIGSVPCVPGNLDHLDLALERFLELWISG